MKKTARLVAVLSILLFHVVNTARATDYYVYLFKGLGNGFHSVSSAFNFAQQVLFLVTTLLELVLITFFFATTGRQQQKAYKLLRYIVVMNYFLYIPFVIYFYAIVLPGLVSFTGMRLAFQVFSFLLSTTSMVLFLRAKPDNQPARVDISNYELVSYTSMGHRFVHYLLDSLFLLPNLFYLLNSENFLRESSLLLSVALGLFYLLYCTLSETIFRQTLGKMATNSCVVSIGIPLTTGRIILRTLARRIPFDNFSFLFKANWHDNVTSTAVVYINSWEKAFAEDEEPAKEPETV